MELDLASTAAPALADRPIYFLRRLASWLLDGLVISAPVIALNFGAAVACTAIVGGTITTAGGGLEGLVASAGAGLIALFVALSIMVVTISLAPIAYLAWVVRRAGPNRGRTLGQQLFGLRIVRTAAGRPIRTRTLVLRELALYAVLFVLLVGSGVLGFTLGSQRVANLAGLVAVGLVLWRAVDGRLPHDRLSGTRMIDWSEDPEAAAASATFERAD